VNPVVPVQLIVDHSLAVECGGYDPDAFAKNRAIEDRRNEDRFHFIDWTKKAFRNVDVIPPGNGIMHQINLEKMSPVIQVQDGVAFPDTCVGTDSHTPHVDALGVIAVGVGGLEAENVMLGRASWMRLPDIVGVELTGRPQPGITATDIVLALTEFLRKQKVVGAYLEFRGEGAAALTLGDRATISNMAPEYGATAAMFFIDRQTIDYLKLTGRDDEQVKLVEHYAKHTGLWADALATAEYERTLSFDLSGVVRTVAGPSNPHARVSTSDLAAKGIAGAWEERPGEMPDGAVIIAAITSCTNTSNPRNVIAAGLLARNANRAGLVRKPWVKTSLAPGSKAVELYLKEAGLLPSSSSSASASSRSRARPATACRARSTRHPAGDRRARPVRDRGAVRQPQLRRPHPPVREAGVPRVAAARRRVRDRGHGALRHREGRVRHRGGRPPDPACGPVAVRRGDRRDREAGREARALPEGLRADVPATVDTGERVSRCTTGARRAPTSAGRRTGKARWPGERTLTGMRPLAVLGDNITTDHLSPSNAILLDSAAGEYLAKMGLPEEDFNSYATHRGDHLTAQRATFANPTLLNEMAWSTASRRRARSRASSPTAK
jgi:2-methylcitrate dehydratase (2-methyl-trans-aconitate forming)